MAASTSARGYGMAAPLFLFLVTDGAGDRAPDELRLERAGRVAAMQCGLELRARLGDLPLPALLQVLIVVDEAHEGDRLRLGVEVAVLERPQRARVAVVAELDLGVGAVVHVEDERLAAEGAVDLGEPLPIAEHA